MANENWLFMIAGTEEEPILHPYTSGSLQNIMKKRIEEAKITNNTSTRIFPMIYLFMALPSQEKTEGRADELQSYLAFQITPTEDAFDAKTNKLKFLVQTFLANTAWSKLMSNSFPESSLIKQKNATIFELNLNLTNEEEIKNHIAKQLEKMSALTMRVMSFKDGVKYGALQQANVKLGAYTMAILGATLAMLAVGILCGNLGYLSGQQYEIVSDNPIRAVWQAIPKKQRNAVVYFSSMAIVLAAVSLLFYFKATPPPQNIKLDDPQK